MTTAELVIEQATDFGGRKWTGFKLPRSKTDAGPKPSSPPLQDATRKPVQETACHACLCRQDSLLLRRP